MHDTIPHPNPVRAFTAEAARTELLKLFPAVERRLDLAGISTPVIEGGEGTPIVLLHGPGESRLKWLRVYPELARTHRVIVPDLPGHGGSAVTGSLDGERVLAWLDELIARTCASPPALVGQIVGGAIAARFAADRGGPVGSLVLVDSLGLSPFQPDPEFGGALMAFVSEPNESTYDSLWARCAFDLPRLQRALGESWALLKTYTLDRARTPQSGEAQHALMEAFGLMPMAEAELARITLPTALIWGRHDLATPVAVAEAVSNRYDWPLQVIEHAGDDPPMEQPEAFVRVLRPVLAVRAERSA